MLMAEALYSTCSWSTAGPNVQALQEHLDTESRALLARLVNITSEPDYSTAKHDAVCVYLLNVY